MMKHQAETRQEVGLRWPARMIVLAAFATVAGHVTAQNYPSRPLRLVVPSSPGGGIDTQARIIGPRLTDNLGMQVVIDNRPGAGGLIGSQIVARADPDGHTILMVAGGFTVNPSLYAKMPFDVVRDFDSVSMVSCAPQVLAIHSSVPASSVKELIQLAKSKPNTLNYASSGIGTSGYMSALRFKTMAGIDIVHVPYKGGGASAAAAVSGQVHLVFITPSAVMPHEKAGRVRILGVTGSGRLPIIPNVPTIAEAALPGYEVQSCYGFLVPAKTHAKIIERLSGEIRGIVTRPEIRTRLEGLGFQVIASTPSEYSAFIKADVAKWQKEFESAGVELK